MSRRPMSTSKSDEVREHSTAVHDVDKLSTGAEQAHGWKLAFALGDGVGGLHDQPAPGELLCAALAACVDATNRLAAVRLKAGIARLTVIVTGDIDSRGSLSDDGVPVG